MYSLISVASMVKLYQAAVSRSKRLATYTVPLLGSILNICRVSLLFEMLYLFKENNCYLELFFLCTSLFVCFFFYHIQISTMHKQQVNQIIMDCLTKHIYGMANIMYSVLQIQNLLVCFSRLLQIYKQLYKTTNPTREIGNRGNTYASFQL